MIINKNNCKFLLILCASSLMSHSIHKAYIFKACWLWYFSSNIVSVFLPFCAVKTPKWETGSYVVISREFRLFWFLNRFCSYFLNKREHSRQLSWRNLLFDILRYQNELGQLSFTFKAEGISEVTFSYTSGTCLVAQSSNP